MTKIPEETLAHWERERARQLAELVTEEMLHWAAEHYEHEASPMGVTPANLWALRAALNAVAPMIAARGASHHWDKHMPATEAAIRAAEREACERLAKSYECPEGCGCGNRIAAAIRARGEP